jgi:hypothetical protein
MDINQAVDIIEAYLEQYKDAHPGKAPVEAKVNPSGDEKDAVKVWLNFGPKAEAKVAELEKELHDALLAAHPELKAVTLRVRSQAF